MLHCLFRKECYICLHFSLGIPVLYTAVAIAMITSVKNYDISFLSPLESFEGTKIVLVYGKSYE